MAGGDQEIGYIGLGSMGLGAPPTFVDFTLTAEVSKQVAFRLTCGTPVVYAGMATNLHENLRKGGASLHIHNRTESKAKSLIDKGAKWESSPAEVAKKCHITFSCMFADDGLKSTFQAWLSGKPRQGSIYVDSSTVYPGTVKELTAEAEKAGQHLASSSCRYPVVAKPSCSIAISFLT